VLPTVHSFTIVAFRGGADGIHIVVAVGSDGEQDVYTCAADEL